MQHTTTTSPHLAGTGPRKIVVVLWLERQLLICFLSMKTQISLAPLLPRPSQRSSRAIGNGLKITDLDPPVFSCFCGGVEGLSIRFFSVLVWSIT